MAASINDKITKTFNSVNPNVATVTSTRTAGATTLACDNLAGWPTDTAVHFSTYQIDTSNNIVAGTQIDWKGIVSGNNIGSLTRLAGATDSGSTIGDVVEANPTASWANDLATGFTAEHSQLDGTHTDVTATSVDTDTLVVNTGTTLPAGDIVTADLADASVTPTKLATGAATDYLATSQSTTSTSFTDLATAGPAVTVNIGSNGLALVTVTASMFNSTSGSVCFMGFAVSGASTIAASDTNALTYQSSAASGQHTGSYTVLLTGLTAGSTTFTSKYHASANTANFRYRQITVVPL